MLRSFSYDQYQIFFNLWGNGGPNWIHEYGKFMSEEANHWTTVHRKKYNHKKSYRDAVLRNHRLTGVNRVPIGNHNVHPRQVDCAPRSVFDCIGWAQLDHQKDQFMNVQSSIFDRLEWPVVDHQTHHQKDNQIVENAKAHVPSVKQPQKSSCDGSHSKFES
jgi:hypothetical protein